MSTATTSPARWASFTVDEMTSIVGLTDAQYDPDSPSGLLLRAVRDELVDVVIDFPETLTDPAALMKAQSDVVEHAMDVSGIERTSYGRVGDNSVQWRFLALALTNHLLYGMIRGSLVIPR